MRLGTLGRKALAGWAGLDWSCRAAALQGGQRRAALREQQWLPEAQIIPMPACGITWHIPDRRRSSLGGLVQNQRKLHPPGCSAPQSSTFPAKWETALRGTEKMASFVCLLVYVKQLSAEVYIIAAVKKGAVLPIKAEGHPRCVFFRLEGQQVSCCMAITKSLCCG